MPVIRIELENMKMAIQAMMSERQLQIDEYLKVALDKELTPEKIQAIINTSAKAAVEESIKSAVDHFFKYGGPGGQFIKEEATEILKLQLSCMGIK
jgi:UDP-glucose 4-epimerase